MISLHLNWLIKKFADRISPEWILKLKFEGSRLFFRDNSKGGLIKNKSTKSNLEWKKNTQPFKNYKTSVLSTDKKNTLRMVLYDTNANTKCFL